MAGSTKQDPAYTVVGRVLIFGPAFLYNFRPIDSVSCRKEFPCPLVCSSYLCLLPLRCSLSRVGADRRSRRLKRQRLLLHRPTTAVTQVAEECSSWSPRTARR